MDPIQAIVDAALAVVRQRRGETPASGDVGDPLDQLVAAVEAYEQQQLAGPSDAAAPLPSLPGHAQNSHETQEHLALALLSLTMFSDYGVLRAWKSLDWDVMDRLYAHGWIRDPKGKAKSVVFTPEGAAYALLLAERYFGPREESVDCYLPPKRPRGVS
jgi:hypothetical protein